MLPDQVRMRSPEEFRLTVRRGVRVARPTLVVHARIADSPPAQVGFVVSKAVGNAVTRNRTKRRLRHLAAERLAGLPMTARVVVRALPAAASHPSQVPADFAAAWDRAVAKVC